MPGKLPCYEEHGSRFQADTCLPVAQAAAAGRLHHVALVHGHYPGNKLPREALPGLKSVGYWDCDQPQDWGLDWHRNEGIELTFLEGGQMAFAADNATYELGPGDLTITRPWQQHRLGDPHLPANRLYWMILDVGVRRPHQPWRWPDWMLLTPADRNELTDMLRHNEQPVWHATSEIHQCFKRIGRAVETDENGSRVSSVAIYLNELLVLLLDMFRNVHLSLDKSLSSSQRSVKLFWDELCADREALRSEWTVAAMARRCGLGMTQFIHQTKRLMNVTPLHYLNHCRLQEAARLLREEPTLNVTEVALSCGFSCGQYFATLFHRKFGQTPSAYRRPEGAGEK